MFNLNMISLHLKTPLLCTGTDRHGWLVWSGIRKACHQSSPQVQTSWNSFYWNCTNSIKRINSSMPDLINPCFLFTESFNFVKSSSKKMLTFKHSSSSPEKFAKAFPTCAFQIKLALRLFCRLSWLRLFCSPTAFMVSYTLLNFLLGETV